MSRILVTGAAGFIGFHLSKSLLDDEYELLGIDNVNNYYNPKLKHARLNQLKLYKNFTFLKIDIANRESLTEAFTNFKPNKVVNLAAQTGVRYSIENPYTYMDANLVGFLNILELCRRNEVEGIIYASSSSVYGGNKKIPFSVDDQVDKPISLYAATKRAVELMAHSYSHLYDLHTTGLRYFTVYGPWGRPDMAMFLFVDNILKSKPIQVFNHGNMKRDFTFIDDIVSGTRSAMEKNYLCEIFNLGTEEENTTATGIATVEAILGTSIQIENKPARPGDQSRTKANIDKARKLLNYNPTTGLKEGLEAQVAWFKKSFCSD